MQRSEKEEQAREAARMTQLRRDAAKWVGVLVETKAQMAAIDKEFAKAGSWHAEQALGEQASRIADSRRAAEIALGQVVFAALTSEAAP